VKSQSFGTITVAGIILFSIFAKAAVDQQASSFVLCKNQKNVRTIRITPTSEADGCQITYSKAGVDEVVGQSHSVSGCQSVLGQIQANLESSKWNCRKVEAAQITWGSEIVH
jgi:hypothetical protein